MNIWSTRSAAVAAIFLSSSGTALAHTGHGDGNSFAQGLLHPIGGLDHVLAMVAVGLYAALLCGRALWLAPAAFVGVMALGGTMGAAGYALPYTEVAIALSVIFFGAAVASRLSLPPSAAMVLVGAFAIFHGHAHGAEMRQAVSSYAYLAGFMLATALLHGTGMVSGLLAGRLAAYGGRHIAQAAGGAIALAGLAILSGVA